jgi:tetratricopeptide (TPR) repeat protein
MTSLSVERMLSRAQAMARGGSFLEAHRLYRDVLSRYPENRRAAEGLRALQTPTVVGNRALAKAAEEGLARVLALARAGRSAEALDACRALAARHGDRVDVLYNLGTLALGAGEAQEAVTALGAALRLQPTLPQAHNNLGNALRRLGRRAEAATAYRNAAALDPGAAGPHVGLGMLALDADEIASAIGHFRQALALDPERADALSGLGAALTEYGSFDAAVACLEAALRIRPGAADILNSLGNSLREAGRLEEAIAAYRSSIAADPRLPAAHNNLGTTLACLGREADARAAYDAALALAPGSAATHRNRAALVRFTPDCPELAALTKAIEAAEPAVETMMHFAFALGKARDDLGEVDSAFEAFSVANALRKTLAPFHIGDEERTFAAIRIDFAGPVASAPERQAAVRPVFIVGMPRSGTSLVEEILASHSAVAPLGETATLERSLNALRRDGATMAELLADEARLAALREDYLARATALAGAGDGRSVVTDKLPANHRRVGLIAAAFPDAVILDVRREAPATAWSIFTHYFASRGNDWAYDLSDIARYHRLYDGLMAFWAGRFPGRVATVDYEALVAAPEAGIRAILDLCRLPFEPACLAPHRNKRAVKTASATQVRQPIYGGSSAAWRRYEHHLGPMLAILEGRG